MVDRYNTATAYLPNWQLAQEIVNSIVTWSVIPIVAVNAFYLATVFPTIVIWLWGHARPHGEVERWFVDPREPTLSGDVVETNPNITAVILAITAQILKHNNNISCLPQGSSISTTTAVPEGPAIILLPQF